MNYFVRFLCTRGESQSDLVRVTIIFVLVVHCTQFDELCNFEFHSGEKETFRNLLLILPNSSVRCFVCLFYY